MDSDKKPGDLSEKIQAALDNAIKKEIKDAQARNDYLVIGDKDGNVINIPAKYFQPYSSSAKYSTSASGNTAP